LFMFLVSVRHPPRSPPSPYTTLFRSFNPATPLNYMDHVMDKLDVVLLMSVNPGFGGQKFIPETLVKLRAARAKLDQRLGNELLPDRKSTRLNSSHVKISYAVFCLKKK